MGVDQSLGWPTLHSSEGRVYSNQGGGHGMSGSEDQFPHVLIRPSRQRDAPIELAWLDDAPFAPLPG